MQPWMREHTPVGHWDIPSSSRLQRFLPQSKQEVCAEEKRERRREEKRREEKRREEKRREEKRREEKRREEKRREEKRREEKRREEKRREPSIFIRFDVRGKVQCAYINQDGISSDWCSQMKFSVCSHRQNRPSAIQKDSETLPNFT
ncbi:hypothetical protein Q9233_000489 [Columba guinea]|nr:hypothetical protein Q9233_000489 [Columba guinea]